MHLPKVKYLEIPHTMHFYKCCLDKFYFQLFNYKMINMKIKYSKKSHRKISQNFYA